MKTQLIKYGRKWSLYSGLFTVIAYAALTLNSPPAYADACTEQECVSTCIDDCGNYGGWNGTLTCNGYRIGDVECGCRDGTQIFVCS